MVNLEGKNILICCDLKKEKVIFFNYFDSNESEMIYTAKNIEDCADILDSEKIDCLIIESSENLIQSPKQLHKLTKEFPETKVAVLIKNEGEIPLELYHQFQQVAGVVLFSPISELEIDIKISQLLSENNQSNNSKNQVEIVEKSTGDSDNSGNSDVEQGLWDVFFFDSIQAKIIVNAKTKKIIYVNEQLTGLLQLEESEILGKSWGFMDDENNQQKYPDYVKEINTKDKAQFTIKYKDNNKFYFFNANYQMAVLDGEIVFIGVIDPETQQGVSDELFQNLARVNQIDIRSGEFKQTLSHICEFLKLDFLLYFECQSNKLLKPVITGDKAIVKRFLERSLEYLMPIILANKTLNIDRDNSRNNEFVEILDNNSLHTFCNFPIYHEDKTYGTIIGGGSNPVDNWQVVTLTLNALAKHCLFGLFQKNIVEQRAVDGLVDKLTGLPNRNAMTRKFAKLIEAGMGENTYLALMIIDIDKINYFNKSLGIELTNQIIKSVAQIMVSCIRNKGQVYRLSGDEFLILLRPHKEKKVVEYIAFELIEMLSKPLLLSNGEDIEIEFNIGASIFPDDGQTVSSMMKNADLAMYDAKLAGNNNYVVFKHSETGQALKQKVEMEEKLKIAIKKKHIKVFFQPKINAVTEDIVGFEALVRWVDPEIGMVNPEQFIPLAEETGLINPIGEYVTQRSCEMIVKWQKMYGLVLSCSINLSIFQLL
ncbi:MAG: diguanylate cyclase, partial [Proteobacteria bacterium]|nr:diguanylate cyclase [Pseudomonadota bacterium]